MHTDIPHAYTRPTVQVGCVHPPAVFPFCFCSKMCILTDALTPKSLHRQKNLCKGVCARASLSHLSSHWQRVCRMCNGPTGELILLTTRLRNISFPPKGEGWPRSAFTHRLKHVYHSVNTGHSHIPWQILTQPSNKHKVDDARTSKDTMSY